LVTLPTAIRAHFNDKKSAFPDNEPSKGDNQGYGRVELITEGLGYRGTPLPLYSSWNCGQWSWGFAKKSGNDHDLMIHAHQCEIFSGNSVAGM
jgi:hypothetical protein